MKIKALFCGALLAGLVPAGFQATVQGAPTPATQTREQRGSRSEQDYKFLMNATRGGMMEVRLGQMAREKSASANVKSFGERMATDHGKMNAELHQIAVNKGASPPAEMTRSDRSEFDKFDNLKGADFDRTYVQNMVKDHQKDLKEFEDASKKLDDKDLRDFARNAIPTLQEHMRLAKEIEKSK